jgi:hypothetical protein
MKIFCQAENTIHGSVIRAVDLFFNLKDLGVYRDKLYLYTEDFLNVVKKLQEYTGISLEEIKLVSKEIDDDFLVSDCRIFGIENFKLSFNTLLIQDSLSLHDFKTLPCNNIKFLCNPYMKTLIESQLGNVDVEEYFQKLSRRRLNHLEEKYKKHSGILTSEHYGKVSWNSKALFHAHGFSEYHFKRRFEYGKGDFRDNFPRLVFEFLWLGRKVFYSSEGKKIDDGFTSYLNLFNVDDKVSRFLDISRDEIEEKLFMKENDLMVKIACQ